MEIPARSSSKNFFDRITVEWHKKENIAEDCKHFRLDKIIAYPVLYNNITRISHRFM